MEPTGPGEAFVDFGDWQEEWTFDCVVNIEDLKRQTCQRLASPL